MKVAVAAQGQNLDSPVDLRFGRAPFFLLVDSETLECESISNPAVNSAGGAGIQTAQLLARSGARAVVTGNVGPNAMSALRAAGIEVYAARGGTVRETVQAFLRGELVPLADATVASHLGTGARSAGRCAGSAPGAGVPGGSGMGRGMGRGRGGRM
ncbi:MAG: NifB/NifX family molybdenum-iron cluster-binding protein [Bacillota bacterium]